MFLTKDKVLNKLVHIGYISCVMVLYLFNFFFFLQKCFMQVFKTTLTLRLNSPHNGYIDKELISAKAICHLK